MNLGVSADEEGQSAWCGFLAEMVTPTAVYGVGRVC